MAEDVTFHYRLPLLYLRVAGTETRTHRAGEAAPTVERQATVTTETGADLLSDYIVRLSSVSMATQKSTWSMLPDGRLSGAELSSTAEPVAGLSAAVQAGATVLGIAAPALIAAGPVGWAALIGVTGAAAIGTGIAAGAFGANIVANQLDGDAPDLQDPDDLDPTSQGVDSAFVADHPEDAQALAELRAADAATRRAHAHAVRAAATAVAAGSGDAYAWQRRVGDLQHLEASILVGLHSAEQTYAAWMASRTTVEVVMHDIRLRADDLPSEKALEEWCTSADDAADRPWEQSLPLQTLVSLDLDEPSLAETTITKRQEHEVSLDPDIIHYRPLRPIVVKVWKLVTPVGDGPRTLELVDVRRLFAAVPGNESQIAIASDSNSSDAVTTTFDDSGALVKVSTTLEDPRLHRAKDISALLSTASAAIDSGAKIRSALSGPSLVDQAAEAKAAQELGLVPVAVDPFADLKKKVAEQQLRAQLKLAEQLQAASSPPVFVTVGG